jgi:hypothetical protein
MLHLSFSEQEIDNSRHISIYIIHASRDIRNIDPFGMYAIEKPLNIVLLMSEFEFFQHDTEEGHQPGDGYTIYSDFLCVPVF